MLAYSSQLLLPPATSHLLSLLMLSIQLVIYQNPIWGPS